MKISKELYSAVDESITSTIFFLKKEHKKVKCSRLMLSGGRGRFLFPFLYRHCKTLRIKLELFIVTSLVTVQIFFALKKREQKFVLYCGHALRPIWPSSIPTCVRELLMFQPNVKPVA